MLDHAEAGVRPGEMAGFHDLLEGPQMVSHLLTRFLAEQLGDLRPEGATGRIDPHLDLDHRAPATRTFLEVHRTGAVNARPRHRCPGEPLVGPVLGDLSIPFEG